MVLRGIGALASTFETSSDISLFSFPLYTMSDTGIVKVYVITKIISTL
jgi:hypothetical protein